METKTAKITSVQENQRSYDSRNGKAFVHLIKFEGDQLDKAWEYHSTKDKCEKFKVGESTTFDIDVQVNGQYTNYKIKPKQAEGGNGNFKKSDPKDSGVITYLSCFSSACNFYSGRLQSNSADVLNFTEEAFKKAMEKSTLNK